MPLFSNRIGRQTISLSSSVFSYVSFCVSKDKWSWRGVLRLQGTWVPHVLRLNYFLNAGNRYSTYTAGGLCYWICYHWFSVVIEKHLHIHLVDFLLYNFFFPSITPLSLFYFISKTGASMAVFVLFPLPLTYVNFSLQERNTSAKKNAKIVP